MKTDVQRPPFVPFCVTNKVIYGTLDYVKVANPYFEGIFV